MRTLNIAEDVSAAAASTASTPVDLAAQNAPFLSNYSAVAAINLQAVDDAVITVEGSDDVTFATGVEDLAVVDLTGESGVSKVVFLEIVLTKQYIRLHAEEVTTGAGAASLDLLGN